MDGLHRRDQAARQGRVGLQRQRDRSQHPLLFERTVVAVEGEEIMQIERDLRSLRQRAVRAARRQVGVAIGEFGVTW